VIAPRSGRAIHRRSHSPWRMARKCVQIGKETPNPGAGHLQYTEAGGKDVSCYGMLLRTSNPPKVEIDFRWMTRATAR
jgi:hypothetical protein